MELACALPAAGAAVLGITGTNGKSTTTALTRRAVRAGRGLRPSSAATSGRRCREAALEPPRCGRATWSSCPASSSRASTRCGSHGAAVLNLTPDHLDRYASHDDYARGQGAHLPEPGAGRRRGGERRRSRTVMRLAARARRPSTASPCGPAPAPAGGLAGLAAPAAGRLPARLRRRRASLPARQPRAARARTTCRTRWRRRCSRGSPASAATRVQAGLDAYPGLAAPARDRCAMLDGVEWVNDSKATNVDSVLVALRRLPQGTLLADRRREGEGRAVRAAWWRRRGGKVKGVLTIGQDARRHRRGLRGRVRRCTPARRWTRRCARARDAGEARATWCCSRRPAPPTTSSRTSSTAATRSSALVEALVSECSAIAELRRRSRRSGFDPLLLGAVLALVALGLVMVYSASAVTAQEKLGDSFYFLKRQLRRRRAWAWWRWRLAMKLGYRRLARLAYPLLLLAIVLLVLVLIPGVGTVGRAARGGGFACPGFCLQPAEVAKFAWVVYLAYSLAKKREKVATFSVGFLPHLAARAALLVGAVHAAAGLRQLGGAALPALRAALRRGDQALATWWARCCWRCRSAYRAIAHSPYRMKRILAFLDPWAHRHDVGYQVAESLMSIGSGGVIGPGPGRRPAEALLPARGAHRLHLLHHRRGAGPGRRGAAGRRSTASSSGAGCARRSRAAETFGTYLGLGITSLHRLPGGGEHVRGDGAAADQGAHAAVRLLRRHARWSC